MLIIKFTCFIGLVSNIYAGVNYNCHYTLSTGVIYSFCCDNHEEKDGQCTECQIGYKSIDGNPCVTCPEDWWGRKCKTKCRCQENERCNHKTGCTKQLVGLGNFSTINFKEVTEVKTYINTWKIDETTDQVYIETNNKDTRFIILYIMIASATVICVAVVFFCSNGNRIGMCKRPAEGQSHQLVQSQSHQPIQCQSHQSVQQNRVAEYIEVIDENAYESIEEVSADDISISDEVSDNDDNDIPANNEQNSNNTIESARVVDDGYLTPYEPLNDHIEKHDYKKIEPTVNTSFAKEDTSSDSDKSSTDSSGYLKPVKIADFVI